MVGAEPGLGVCVSDDRQSVTVTLHPAGGDAGSTTFSLEQLTSVVRALGRARQHMICNRPMPPLEGQHVPAVFDINWYVGPELSRGGSALVFEHPWYGPLAFVVSPDHGAQIARALTMQSQMASLASTVRN